GDHAAGNPRHLVARDPRAGLGVLAGRDLPGRTLRVRPHRLRGRLPALVLPARPADVLLLRRRHGPVLRHDAGPGAGRDRGQGRGLPATTRDRPGDRVPVSGARGGQLHLHAADPHRPAHHPDRMGSAAPVAVLALSPGGIMWPRPPHTGPFSSSTSSPRSARAGRSASTGAMPSPEPSPTTSVRRAGSTPWWSPPRTGTSIRAGISPRRLTSSTPGPRTASPTPRRPNSTPHSRGSRWMPGSRRGPTPPRTRDSR